MDPQSATQPTDSASQRASDAQPHSLPEELTSFVGRSVELAQVRELLGEARMLTLVGAGGCGKSRLALQSAVGGLERFPDGVWWVELAPLENAELLVTAVTSTLGLRDRPGRTPLEVLCEQLDDRRTLLVLDNCEHLLEGCAALVEVLLRSCRGLVVLVTSREALQVPGELRYRVPSLTLPGEHDSVTALTQSDAVRLFIDRAVQARPNFAVTEENAAAVAAICQRLDGIPLAIELAAVRVRMLSPERIATELDDRFHLLTQGARTVTPRHQTLRASIDWSHELCSEGERVVLRRLSVWTGGWTLDGAEAVSADEHLDRRDVLDLLTALLDKSLIDTEERDGEIRFGILETIRQYAAERLADAGEVDATRARHLMWCLELAEAAEPELVRHDAGKWLQRLEPEASNLRAALDFAIQSDGDAALRLSAALAFFWLVRGRFDEGSAALARAVDGAPQASPMRAKVLWALAEIAIWRGEFGASLEYSGPALADGEAVGDRSVMARALKTQGLILNLKDHLHREPLERSLELAREADDEWCAADSMRLLGSSYVRQGAHDLARPILDEGYALALALGHRPLHAWYFGLRAWGELEHGCLPAARELAEQASGVSNEAREPITLGLATSLLVECDVLEGMPERGRARGEPCSQLMGSMGVGPGRIWVENALSLADVADGSPDAARERIEAILEATATGRSYDIVSKARRRLAVARLLLGDLEGGEREVQLLSDHGEVGRNEHVQAMARLLLGRIAFTRGDVIEAERHLHQALGIATRRRFRLHCLNALEWLARVAALTSSPTESARLLAAAKAGREQLGVVRWPPELELWAGVEADLRAELGDEAFSASWAKGLALQLDEAVEYVSRARGKRKRPSRGWDALTPTELEVARHAAGGRTNPQIGERMFISRGTVKAHLSHIFAKLGISSRSELAAEAIRRGLDAPDRTDTPAR